MGRKSYNLYCLRNARVVDCFLSLLDTHWTIRFPNPRSTCRVARSPMIGNGTLSSNYVVKRASHAVRCCPRNATIACEGDGTTLTKVNRCGITRSCSATGPHLVEDVCWVNIPQANQLNVVLVRRDSDLYSGSGMIAHIDTCACRAVGQRIRH
jgi:hypothetical protein